MERGDARIADDHEHEHFTVGRVGKRPSNGSGLDGCCWSLDRSRLLRSLIDIQNLYLADT